MIASFVFQCLEGWDILFSRHLQMRIANVTLGTEDYYFGLHVMVGESYYHVQMRL